MRGSARRLFACGASVLAIVGAASDARALDPGKTLAQYVAHQWKQSDDGLPENSVASMVQSRDGYLWMASQEGLVRFDGERFTVISTRDVPAIGTNDIDVLTEDAQGALWFGTRGAGVVRYVNGAFTVFGVKEGLGHAVVLALKVARDGALWVGTRGGGVSRLQDGHFTTYRATDGLASDVVWSVTQLADGAMAFGTDAGVTVFRDGKLARLEGAPESQVRALYEAADGALWVGSLVGLTRIRDGNALTLGEADGLGGAVFSLLEDHDTNLWIGTQTGIRRLSKPGGPGKATALGTLSALVWDSAHPFVCLSFLEDREGNLWAGTRPEGLLRLQDGKVTTFGASFVWATYEAADGKLWLATEEGLLSLHGDDLVPASPGSPLVIYALAATHDVARSDAPTHEGLWVSTQSRGIFRYDDGKLTAWTGDPSLATATVTVTYQAPDGSMWIGTQRGLEHVEGSTIHRFTQAADGVPEDEFDAIEPAPDGSLWMGGRAGIVHWKSGTFTWLREKDGLPNAPIESLLVDGDDVWIATSGGGLALMRNGRIGQVRARNGLFDDVVYALVDDRRGNFWMTCNHGIFHASKAELAEVALGTRAQLASFALTTSDGMKSSECNDGRPSGIRAHDGTLWFPTTAGTVRVDPAHMRTNTVVPPVKIEETRVDRAPITLTNTPRKLDADSRDFQFAYTALSFTAPERVRFKYQLEGFDKDWVDAGSRRIAYYTNLSPGKYRFRVKAANDDGVWNDEGASVAFLLAPHFYQTIPFYLLCGFGLMFLGSVTVRARLLALRARAALLETWIEERTRELETANRDLAGAFKALAEKDARLHEDLLEAQAFQQRLLPRLPSGGAVRFRALYRPADLVGGDIYDICQVAERHYRVFIADTTGHGVQASLRTMVLKTEYDRVKLNPDGPARVLSELNRNVATTYPDLELRCSACCLDVIADRDGSARLVYANAAHPPLLRIARGRVDEMYSRGTFLGVMADAPFLQIESKLAPGERLLAYTDGIYEQEDPSGHAFGMERMITLLTDYALDAEGIVQLLDTEVTTFSAGRPLADDMLLICIECTGDRRSKAEIE